MKPTSPSKLRFEPEGHKYWLGKKRIPGVSEILSKVGLAKTYEGVDTFYRDRGTATHKAIELYLKGRLDQSSLDPAIQPQFRAFLSYWTGRPDTIMQIEHPLAMANGEFAGIPDLVTNWAIYDWKCSKDHDRTAELQGQAYKMLVGGDQTFIVVELHDDGTFEEFNYGDKTDLWPHVLELFRWKVK